MEAEEQTEVGKEQLGWWGGREVLDSVVMLVLAAFPPVLLGWGTGMPLENIVHLCC